LAWSGVGGHPALVNCRTDFAHDDSTINIVVVIIIIIIFDPGTPFSGNEKLRYAIQKKYKIKLE